MEHPELKRSTKRVMTLCARMANRRMRAEVLPLLRPDNPNLARSWNPLQPDWSDLVNLSLKLRTPDGLVTLALQDESIMAQIDEIVEDSMYESLFRNIEVEHTPFIAAVIRDLMREEPVHDATTKTK